MKTQGGICWLALVAALLLSSSTTVCRPQLQASPTAAATITQVEVSCPDEKTARETIVRVSGIGRLLPHAERLSSPERLVLDFAGARLGVARTSVPSAFKPVRRVRLGQFKPDMARVVVDLEYVVPYSVKAETQSVTVIFATAGAAPVRSPAIPPPRPEPQKAAAYAPSTQTLPLVLAPQATLNPSVAPPSRPPIPPTPAAPSPALPQQPAEASPNAVDNGMLTLRAQNEPLRAILEEIGSKANVAIIFGETVGNERISVEFGHYRLDEALRQMLRDYDVVFSYGVDPGKGSASLNTVWVYPANQGPGMSRSSLSSWKAGTKQLEQTLASDDPEARANAIDSLIKRQGRQSVSVVLDALRDPSEDVREKALSRALSMGVPLPENTLTDLALNDESSNVRLLALQALPVDPAFRWVAERAVKDWSPKVARTAKDILHQLDAVGKPAS